MGINEGNLAQKWQKHLVECVGVSYKLFNKAFFFFFCSSKPLGIPMTLDKECPATLTSLQPISTSYTNDPLLLRKLLFRPLNANHHKHILRNTIDVTWLLSCCFQTKVLYDTKWLAEILCCSGHSYLKWAFLYKMNLINDVLSRLYDEVMALSYMRVIDLSFWLG